MKTQSANTLCIYDSKLLLILRDDFPDIYEPNKWGLPGGGVEKNENHLQACRRELMEEISVSPAGLTYLFSRKEPTGHLNHVYFAEFTRDEFHSIRLGDEGQKLDFFNIADLSTLDLTADLKVGLGIYKDQVDKFIRTRIFNPQEIQSSGNENILNLPIN